MRKFRRYWLILAVIALAAAGGIYAYYQNETVAAAQEATEAIVQTATARRGEIVVSATGAGTVIAAKEISLSFATSGTLTELLVNVGDQVVAGDVLARVDDTDAQQALVSAQLQLTSAAMQTDATQTQTGISYDDISVEQAQISLQTAQSALDDLLNWEMDADEIALAEANLAAAQASYNAARGQEAASSNNITIQAYNVQDAEEALVNAQEAYAVAWEPARDWELNDPRRADALEREREQTANAVAQAQQNLEIARLNYNSTVASTSSSSSVSAQGNLLSAQQALAAAQTGPTEDEIAAAQLTVHQAELSLQTVLLNQESHQLSLAQAELNVVAAQATLDGTTLIAPMDGTVMSINYNVGETVSGAILVLADLEQPLLELYLDESDIGMAGVDYEVEVVFEAFPDDTFVGHIVQVDPQLVNEANVTAVRAIVQLDTDSFAKPVTLPVGLSATVEVIGGRAANAVLVPIEALREITTGQYALFVMTNGEPELRMVEVGLTDFTYAEILSGLEEGEVVTTGIIETE